MNRKVERKNCLISILLSCAAVMLLPPTNTEKLTVKSFGRWIGQGIANDWDVSKIIRNFYGWFLLFIVLFTVFLFVLEYLRRRTPEVKEQKAWKMLDVSGMAASVVVVFRMLTYFWRLDSFSFGYFLILGIFILDLIYCYSGLEKRVAWETYALIKMLSVSVSFTFTVIFRGQWNDGRAWLLHFFIFFGMLFVGFCLCKDRLKTWKPSNKNAVWNVCTLLMGLPLLTSVYIEAIHVLNQYSVFVHKPRRVYCVVLLVFGLLAVCLCLLWKNRGIRWTSTGEPLLLAGLACLASQIPLQQQVSPNLFESANASVLISDFLNFGKIPVVEHYGGHMLKNVVGGILYAVINQDNAGAIVSPYGGYIYAAAVLIFYFFLKELLQSKEAAFWYTLCLPFMSCVEYYIVGLLVCLSVAGYVKKHGYGRALLIWLSCAVAVLYRLDLGTAFGAAAVIGLAVYLFQERQRQWLKELTLTFLGVISGGLLVWTLLCVARNVSPIERIREFVLISLSNVNWGTGLLGDKYSIFFSAAYMILPLVCAWLLLYLIFFLKPQDGERPVYNMILMLGIAYFVNVPRGLVRHTLNELAVKTVVFSGGLFIVAAVFFICKKQMVFLYSFIAMILLWSFMAGKTNLTAEPLLEKVPAKMKTCVSGWSSDWMEITEHKQRVQVSEKAAGTISACRNVFDLLLDEGDTYLDFMNVSFLYSALGRECPVYVAQSPGHLSGEDTQEMFIREIEQKKDRIPLALLPAVSASADRTALDSIANISRYYKVAEYIYQNYRPLCTFEDMALWCRFEEYEALAGRLGAAYDLIDYGYDGGEILYLHDYPMYEIPYLWGTYDTKSGWENPVMADLSEEEQGVYRIETTEEIDKNRGNYLLLTCQCDSEYGQEANNAEIVFGSTETGEDALYRFRFQLRPGEQRYLFRLSADYYWYAHNIDKVSIRTEEEISHVKMQILQGD